MNFTTALDKSILPVIGGTLPGGYAGLLVFAAFLGMRDGPPLQRWLHVPVDASGLSFYALLAGAPAALLPGWPAYAWLLGKDRANWLSAAAVGLVPAALVLLQGRVVPGGLVAMYGLCIAWIAHALRLWFARAAAIPRGA